MGVGLLERTEELATLDAALASAVDGRGGVVLVAGEAGVGKSSLIRAFTRGLGDGTRVLVGACDDLITSRTLGAVRDAFAGRLGAVLTGGTRDDVLTGVLAELTAADRPTVLVVEDVHWADDATIDVLRYVCRRVESAPAVVVVSYRDDEIGPDHPAQRLLGGLSGGPVRRLVLARLTRDAVATLAGGTAITSSELYRLTGGNPFYVTEVVAAGGAAVPPTVADAVLARVHRLDPAVRRALGQLAVVPSQVELSLARALLGDLDVLEEAERRGVLEIRRDALAFRHELARRAVEDALPVSERLRLHSAVLEILLAREDVDLSRALHHAVEAADDARVVELAPQAAGQAARAGSYTQEITCDRLLIERAHLLAPATVAAVHQQLAAALWVIDEPDESLGHGRVAVRLQEELGDVVALGTALTVIVPVQWTLTLTDGALADSTRAVELLGAASETPATTFALVYHALLLGMIGHADVLPAARRAAASADRTGDPEMVALSRTCLGRAQLLSGEPDEGLALMRTGLAASQAVNAHTSALMAYGLVVLDLFGLGRFEECRRYVDESIAYANDCEVWYFVGTLRAFGYRLLAVGGEWDAAILGLREIVDAHGWLDHGVMRYVLAPLAELLARRGDEEAPAVLARARDLARRAGCYDDLRATGTAEIETAWLTGRPEDAADAIALLDELTALPGREVDRGELQRWKRRLGVAHEVTPGCSPATAAGLRGDWRAAAAAREADAMPYHRALELLDSGEADPTLDALRILDGLGAAPVARIARGRLRDLGVARVPRGPQPSTRANPAGLSDRQLEVLRLLAEGLTNAEIAARLVISCRTADHHVSAILTKLGVPTGRAAAAVARDLGIATSQA